MAKYKFLAVVLAVSLLGACSIVSKDADGIAIRHLSENDLMIKQRADRHCAAFGKVAVKVQQSAAISDYLVSTAVSTFKCVRRSELPDS